MRELLSLFTSEINISFVQLDLNLDPSDLKLKIKIKN